MKKILSLLVCFGFVIGLGAIAGCGDAKDAKKTTTEKKTEEKKTEEKKGS